MLFMHDPLPMAGKEKKERGLGVYQTPLLFTALENTGDSHEVVIQGQTHCRCAGGDSQFAVNCTGMTIDRAATDD